MSKRANIKCLTGKRTQVMNVRVSIRLNMIMEMIKADEKMKGQVVSTNDDIVELSIVKYFDSLGLKEDKSDIKNPLFYDV